MLKKITLIGLCLICANTIFAQTKRVAARELIAVMKQDSIMDKVFDSMLPSMGVSIESLSNTNSKEYIENMAPMMKTMKAILKKFVDDDMVTIYEKYFTEEELNAMTNFYKTPVGRKFITATPEIQKETMTIMMNKYMPEIMKAVQDFQK